MRLYNDDGSVKVHKNAGNLIGQKIGKITVLSYSDVRTGKNRKLRYNCRCDCGKEKAILAQSLMAKQIKSCGCLERQNKILDRELAIYNRLYSSLKSVAKKYTYNWEQGGCIGFQHFIALISQNCFYCGKPPSQIAKDEDENGDVISETIIYRVGIDRVNTNEGYHFDNCIPCCFNCNRAKSNLSQEDFLELVKSIYNNFYGEHEPYQGNPNYKRVSS